MAFPDRRTADVLLTILGGVQVTVTVTFQLRAD